jgi:hypothetical protein
LPGTLVLKRMLANSELCLMASISFHRVSLLGRSHQPRGQFQAGFIAFKRV